MTVKPTAEVLCNLCNSVFVTYEQQQLTAEQKVVWKRLVNEVLRVLDMKADFDQERLGYLVTVDWNIFVNRSFSEKYLKGKFAMTPYYCSEHDIRCIEDILNENYDYASSIGSVFSCIGYIIIKEDERWRLRWYARDASALADIDQLAL